jgi:hypothetical protein
MPVQRTAPRKPKQAAPSVGRRTKPVEAGLDAKRRKAAQMLRELREGAEALSANADRLLARIS